MSIKAYVGIMGSGKTYEVVSVVIYNALKRGRRVVSNIAGLNFQAMLDAMVAEGVDPDRVGELVCIPHEKVLDPLFWRTDTDVEKGVEAFIQPGDLVALDEIWRFWDGLGLKMDDGGKVIKRPERVMNFIRMHRQMVHPVSGLACDIAIITQDPADMHRSIRGVVEETYLMTKLTAIGSSTRYRVDCFQKTRITRKPLTSHQRSYDASKFGFYKSHSQRKEGDADAREENIDGRGNILKGALFKVILPIGILVAGFSVYVVYKFFNPGAKEVPKTSQIKPGPVVSGQPASTAPAAKVEAAPDWRIVGHIATASGLRFLLASPGGGTRWVVDPRNVKLTSQTAELILPNGDAVVNWSSRPAASMLPGMPR